MKNLALIGALCVLATAAQAQQQPPVTLPAPLTQAVVNHLMVGGTISDGQHLAQQIVDAVQAPAKAAAEEKALRAKIEAETKAAAPMPTPPPIPASPP